MDSEALACNELAVAQVALAPLQLAEVCSHAVQGVQAFAQHFLVKSSDDVSTHAGWYLL